MNTELRPLNLGEILDRTFQIYRAHFALFAGMSALGAAAYLVWATIQTFVQRSLNGHGPTLPRYQAVTMSLSFITIGVELLAFSVVWAAIVHTVAAIYRGEATGIGLALRRELPSWFRLALVTITSLLCPWLPVIAGVGVLAFLSVRMRSGVGANLGYIGIAGLIGLSLLIFIPLGIWLTLRYVLANAVCAYEGARLGQSLRRSVFLGKEMRWRLFLLLLVVGILQYIVAFAVSMPIWVAIGKNPLHPPLWSIIYSLFAGFVASVLTKPIAGIGIALFYFDARIRKEGLDIEWSLQATPTSEAGHVPAGLPMHDHPVG